MHVKLEVETQPLSNLWIKLRRVFKIIFGLAVLLLINAAGVIFAFAWIPNHVRKPDEGIILSWALAIIWTLMIWGNILQLRLEARQEARWRNATD